MRPDLLVSRILDDERLTNDLDSEAAAVLIDRLVRAAEAVAARTEDESEAARKVDALCARGRDIARRVSSSGTDDQSALLRSLLDREPVPD